MTFKMRAILLLLVPAIFVSCEMSTKFDDGIKPLSNNEVQKSSEHSAIVEKDNTIEFTHEEKVLNHYLKELNSSSLSSGYDKLIIIPKIVCRGCVVRAISVLDMEPFPEGKKILFVYPGEYSIPDRLSDNLELILDELSLIDTYNIGLSSINIIDIENGRVKSFRKYGVDNVDDIEW